MFKPSSSFASNVLKLVTGSVFAQGIGVLVVPIVARLFAPKAFGVAALFVSITGVIGVVACLRYQLTIMLPKTDEEAANLLGLSLFFVIIVTGISALIIFFAGDAIVNLLNSPELKKFLWLVPVSVFVSGTFLALNYWNSRTKHFGRLSIARVISSVVDQTTKLGAGFAGFVSAGILIGTAILGKVVSTSVLGGQIWRDDRHLFKASIRWNKMLAGLKRYKEWPKFSTWSGFLNAFSQQLPVWILAFYFSPKIVGFYALGRTVLGMPMSLIGNAVAQVFFQKAADTRSRSGDLTRLVEEVFVRLNSLGIFPILVLIVIGRDLFIVVFGERWAEAGFYVQIMGFLAFFQFISSPISTLFSVLEKQRSALLFNIILLTTRTVSLICGGLTGDPRIALALFSGAGVLVYAIFTIWILSIAGVSLSKMFKLLLKNAGISTPMLSIVVLAKWIVCISPVWVVFSGIISSILYYIIIFKKDQIFQEHFKILIKRLDFTR